MSSRNDSDSTGRRVRPITWAILAWMVIMISAILGAWKGSESQYGALPVITVASDQDSVKVLPFTATDLDGNSFTNPVPEFAITSERLLSVRLPSALAKSTLNIYEVRTDGNSEYTVEAGSEHQLLIPVTTPENGRIEGLAIRSVPVIYDEQGEPSILNGEWSVGFTYAD